MAMTPEDLEEIRHFSRTELWPARAALDRSTDEPAEALRAFADTGLANWWLPEELGGRGFTLTDSVEVVNELAYGDAGVAFALCISILGSTMVRVYGSDELKQRYLTPMAARGRFCATAVSERDAGSELTRIGTVAVRDGDTWVLTGDKFFATNADLADFLVVLARSSPGRADHVAIVVPRQTPGVTIASRWNVNGLRASRTHRVRLEGVRVPVDHTLAGSGLRVLEAGLNASRTLIATTALGLARRIRDECLDYAANKPFRSGLLVDSPVFAQHLGQMETQIDVMKSHLLRAAGEFDAIMAHPDAGRRFVTAGAVKAAITAKIFCGQAGWNVASVGSEMFGGAGYTDELPIGKLLRDMRYISIVEGGDDVLRELVFGRYVVAASRRS
ncbi:acyl-CoA dehydrogenase family protein [Millisia brevis]|uniref:acyl-CoA dehydrogenase family protein n=1 Tax=Millisia brevis TaxID=264148 RepID=UPI000B1D146E|nr:acyl-CoA dehydrogenase family protein [Millisia brevis]